MPSSAGRLAEVFAGGEDAELLDLLRQAERGGDLVRDAAGFLVPRADGEDLGDWDFGPGLPAGQLRAFFVKPLDDASDAARLRAAFGALRRRPGHAVMPMRVAGDRIVSPYLADAADLRAVSASTTDARVVHDHALASYRELRDLDPLLRREMAAEGLAPRPFRLGPRYLRAQRTIGRLFGPDAAAALAAAAPSDDDAGDRLLLSDPKPANLIVTRPIRESSALLEAARPLRIDLDLLAWETSAALLLVLIFFSHPVAFETQGSTAFADQFGRLADCNEGDASATEPELHTALWYHLVRNFASATEAGDMSKGRAMAAHAALAAEQFPGLRVGRAFRSALDAVLADDRIYAQGVSRAR